MLQSHRASSPPGTTEVRYQTTARGTTTSWIGISRHGKQRILWLDQGGHRDPESRPPTSKPACWPIPTYSYLGYRCDEAGLQTTLSSYCPLVGRQRQSLPKTADRRRQINTTWHFWGRRQWAAGTVKLWQKHRGLFIRVHKNFWPFTYTQNIQKMCLTQTAGGGVVILNKHTKQQRRNVCNRRR